MAEKTQPAKKDAGLNGQCRRFCFTEFKLPFEAKLYELGNHSMTFLEGQLEVAPSTGRQHFQGYFELNAKKASSSVVKELKKLGFTFHVSACKGTQAQNHSYVSKSDTSVEGSYVSIGVKMDDEEKIDVWADLSTRIQDGVYPDWNALVRANPGMVGRYTRGVRDLWESQRPKYRVNLIERYGSLLPWQASLLSQLSEPVHPRCIIWVFETTGNVGKSEFVAHLASECGFLSLDNGKKADLACAWNGEHVTIDLSRRSEDLVNYGVLEQLKNGCIFSSKYDSHVKRFAKPHMVVFSNFEPAYDALSDDRWSHVYRIEDKELVLITKDMRTASIAPFPYLDPPAASYKKPRHN